MFAARSRCVGMQLAWVHGSVLHIDHELAIRVSPAMVDSIRNLTCTLTHAHRRWLARNPALRLASRRREPPPPPPQVPAVEEPRRRQPMPPPTAPRARGHPSRAHPQYRRRFHRMGRRAQALAPAGRNGSSLSPCQARCGAPGLRPDMLRPLARRPQRCSLPTRVVAESPGLSRVASFAPAECTSSPQSAGDGVQADQDGLEPARTACVSG